MHRDISENNITIIDPKEADGFTGMLIDEDLAKEIRSGRNGARHQIGTMEYMAIEMVKGVVHIYRHDFDFFKLFFMDLRPSRLGGGKKEKKKKKKRKKPKKRYAMGVDGFEELLDELPPAFDCINPLL